MSTSDTSGELLQANNAPPRAPWSGAASQIRRLHSKYPELSTTAIAKKVGCSHQNVSEVLATFLKDTEPEQLADFQVNKADIFDSIQMKALASITQEHLANSSFMQLVTGAAILEDKARLVRGQATSINVTALLDVAKLIRDKDGQ